MEKEAAEAASVFTPTVLLIVGMVVNGFGLCAMVAMLFGLQRRIGDLGRQLGEFEADSRGDARVVAEILRGFLQGARPRENELAAIGLRRDNHAEAE